MRYPLMQHTVDLPNGPISIFQPEATTIPEIFGNLKLHNAAEPFPYWAKLWPSAIALCRFLQKQPHWVAGKRVAELAAGLGLPSLVAAGFAKQVWCSDISEEAMHCASRSAALNRMTNLAFEPCNWNNLPADFEPELVLLSDINYDPSMFETLEIVLKDLLNKGCTLLLATPQRLMAKAFIKNILSFAIEQTIEEVHENGQFISINIFVLKINT